MSFIDTIGSLAKSAVGFLKGDGLGSKLARTALLGFALNRVNNAANKQNESVTDTVQRGTQLTFNPSTDYSVPVLYGTGFVDGKVTDAFLSSDNTTMWLCVTLCENTGTLIDGTASEIKFDEVYFNNYRLGFRSNGHTADTIWDDSNDNSTIWDGLIDVYPFSGNSESPTGFTTETNQSSANAYDLMPNWTSSHSMNDLVFCIIRVKYNAKQKLTNIGNLKFKLTNTMSQPGDVMYDYMTNTRYGAGIAEEEIYVDG